MVSNAKSSRTYATPKILSPIPESVLDLACTTVVLQFTVGVGVELRVNERLVDQNQIGRTESNAETNLVTQTWYGVSLQEGEKFSQQKLLIVLNLRQLCECW